MTTRRRRFRAKPKPQFKRPLANEEIKSPTIRLIAADGAQLGVVSTATARQQAETGGFDLVLVAEKTDPPVARLLDLGKHIYEQRKKQAKQKAHTKGGETKGVRLGFKTGEHDWAMRLQQAASFLNEGNKVKVEMRLRGREKGRTDLAEKKLLEFIAQLPGGRQEGPIGRSPRGLTVLITR